MGWFRRLKNRIEFAFYPERVVRRLASMRAETECYRVAAAKADAALQEFLRAAR